MQPDSTRTSPQSRPASADVRNVIVSNPARFLLLRTEILLSNYYSEGDVANIDKTLNEHTLKLEVIDFSRRVHQRDLNTETIEPSLLWRVVQSPKLSNMRWGGDE